MTVSGMWEGVFPAADPTEVPVVLRSDDARSDDLQRQRPVSHGVWSCIYQQVSGLICQTSWQKGDVSLQSQVCCHVNITVRTLHRCTLAAKEECRRTALKYHECRAAFLGCRQSMTSRHNPHLILSSMASRGLLVQRPDPTT